VFYMADDGIHGFELWETDGGRAKLVKDINPGSASSSPTFLTDDNGRIFFNADDGSGLRLWRSDGTAIGTVAITPQGASHLRLVLQPVLAGNTLYFVGDDGVHSNQLWKSDGT